ncbi:general transcription factor II-I repeat domain-containing protein 2-like [Halictus rubicundus]|uniref:general transcription factor II-I repeat domain-containing protein 2-like n=1 Tax=Halictus rubicundus TaxID=77578 RepID=UPI00403662C9
MVDELQASLNLKLRNSLESTASTADRVVRASYLVSQILAKKMKPFFYGEIVKECLLAIADAAFPNQKDIISKISLPRFTVARRIDELLENIEESLRTHISKIEWISLAVDESCDIYDTAQLAVFLRGTDSNFNVMEEFASLVPIVGTTTGDDIYREIKTVLNVLNIPMEKIVGISTDGARAMSSMNVENLGAKVLKMSNVLPPIIKIVNFIRSRGVNHREFKEFLKDIENVYGDILFNTEVRWLSRGTMLKRVYDLKNEIKLFLEMKDNPFSQFDDKDWMCDFAFCVDITQHLNELNIKLQGKNKLVTEMFDKIKAFEQKLKIWNQQLKSNSTVNFAILRKENPSETKKYAMEIQILQKEFSSRFTNFRENQTKFDIFSSPFNIDLERIPEEFQMEIIDLQNDTEIRNKFQNDFYKLHFPATKFPLLATHARQMMSLLGSTYMCEQLFSKLKIIKSDRRNRLDDERLKNCIRVAVSSITPNIDKLVNEKKSQVSH